MKQVRETTFIKAYAQPRDMPDLCQIRGNIHIGMTPCLKDEIGQFLAGARASMDER